MAGSYVVVIARHCTAKGASIRQLKSLVGLVFLLTDPTHGSLDPAVFPLHIQQGVLDKGQVLMTSSPGPLEPPTG
jgi:hypothetical protein